MRLIISLVVVLIDEAIQTVGIESSARIVHDDVRVAFRFASTRRMVHCRFDLVIKYVQWRLINVLFTI